MFPGKRTSPLLAASAVVAAASLLFCALVMVPPGQSAATATSGRVAKPAAIPADSPALAKPRGAETGADASVARPSERTPAATPVLTLDGQSPAAVGLQWTDTATGTLINYTLQQASQASNWTFSTLTVIDDADTLTYVATGVSPGVDYAWDVIEYSHECVIVCGATTSQTTNVLNVTQPAVAYLHHIALSPTGVTLEWTNNATYGGLISFQNYTVWEAVETSAFAAVATITEVTSNQSAIDLAPGDSYSFYVETSDCTGGCTGATPSISGTQSNLLTIGSPLELSVTVLARYSTIDLGQSDFFTCTPTGGESPFSYAWDFGTGTYAAGNASESAYLGAEGAQTVTCEVTDSESPPDHAAGSTDVTVNPPLNVTVTANRTAADVGQVTGFTCTAVNGTTPYTLSWSFGDGATSSLANPSHIYSTAGGYAPTCLVEDGAGSVRAPSTSIAISPALDAAASVSSAASAPGTPLTFTATATNGSGVYSSYVWTFGTGSNGSGAETTHAFDTTGDHSVELVVTDSNGANADASVTVDVSVISVVVSPRITSATTGSAFTLSASASGGAGGPYNYTWNFGDGTVGYGASVRHDFGKTGTFTPTLVVTDRLGATNETALPAIAVTAPPPAFGWLTGWVALGIALLVGAIIALFALARRRETEATELESASSAYVPPTDPKRTIRGSKVCDFCGASNLPIRTTCSRCGKPLPRSPVA